MKQKLMEGMPVIIHRRYDKGTISSNEMIVLTDSFEGFEHIPIPKEVQQELRFVGMKGLVDYTTS